MDPCYSRWADWIQAAWASAPPATVLDLCCGTGLMTAELVDRGYRVVGLDASEAMLRRARARLDSSVQLEQAWLPDLPLNGQFDAAVSTLDGLNYLTPPDLEATFAALARLLRPGGWLVFDAHGPGMRPFALANPVISGVSGGCPFTLTTQVEDSVCRTTIDFTGDDDHPSFEETHTQYLHTEEQVHAILRSAGFVVHSVTDEYSDRIVTEATLRAAWVARLEES